MVVRLRLQRLGQRNAPVYRIVAANARSRRDGKHLERLGNYSPVPDASGTKQVALDMERVRYWLSVGAQPTETVAKLLEKAGLIPTMPKPYANAKRRVDAAVPESAGS